MWCGRVQDAAKARLPGAAPATWSAQDRFEKPSGVRGVQRGDPFRGARGDDLAAAVAAYQRAIDAAPDEASSYVSLGVVLLSVVFEPAEPTSGWWTQGP